ncbi:hypothetical protein CHLNCDRAFT_137963 [Chlorella variabilis]|uniref:Probable magnesium transporter n=1 Tax=Chlorella variabilis TaxID=554065 RepID=E1Z4Y4_CHLVA|nr:hypothetical protein CHLNCDRAFT_137963 [Chlorella variabilis]EFN59139.1 hypothetical protein CHLNCDRAFT_137963 [Chlorella variabilis]|eukprot:XP_005851241.1 hypothetical protein CHLNCDRAFT_137963 [Chlorella variabilis]
MALWAVGAIINVVGSIMINLGTNIIKLGHTKTELAAADGGDKPPKMSKEPRRWWSFPGNRVWLGGMLLFTVGNMLKCAGGWGGCLVSFAFTAQSLLSALGVVQFISNIAFGRWVNKEKARRTAGAARRWPGSVEPPAVACRRAVACR